MTTRKLTLILAGAALAAGTTVALAGAAGRPGNGLFGKSGGTCDGSMRGAGMHGAGHRGRGMGPGPGALGPLGMALHRLDLSEAQQTQIQGILEAAQPTFQALHEQLQSSREAFREANLATSFDEAKIRAHVAQQATIHADMAVAAAKVRSQVLAVLTPEQLTELEAMREQMKDCADGWMGHGHKGFGGGPNW